MLNKERKLSVLMSVYNGMPFLKMAVNSILNQTYKDFDFVIIDDGSTDDSLNYLKSFVIYIEGYMANNKRTLEIDDKE